MKIKSKMNPKRVIQTAECRMSSRFFRLHSLQAKRTPSNPEVPG